MACLSPFHGMFIAGLLGRTAFEAFKAGGTVADALCGRGEATLKEAQAVMASVDALGISFQEITDELLEKGCALFCDAFDQVLAAVATKRDALTQKP